MTSDLAYWLAFSKVPGIGPARFRLLSDYFGSVEAAWQAEPGQLLALGLDRRSVMSLLKVRQTLDLAAELQKVEALGVQVFTWDDPGYPPLLKSIADPPFVLYVRGSLTPSDEWALGVVGTRSASVYGKQCTEKLVRDLAASGVTIVSGLALGIDTVAHKTALEAGGRTLAVLGSGVDEIYPRQNRRLSDDILQNGAIISEFPLGTRPEAGNFPRRNRIISGLSLGVLFAEGGEKSGARITVDFALEQGREVFAVPGKIFDRGAQGPNKIIQQGAKLVTSIGDILEELNLTMVAEQTEARQIIPDNPAEAAILKQLSMDPLHVDELGQRTGLDPATLSSNLVMMELKGKVRGVGGMNYTLVREVGVDYSPSPTPPPEADSV